jgi:hypothetical protein
VRALQQQWEQQLAAASGSSGRHSGAPVSASPPIPRQQQLSWRPVACPCAPAPPRLLLPHLSAAHPPWLSSARAWTPAQRPAEQSRAGVGPTGMDHLLAGRPLEGWPAAAQQRPQQPVLSVRNPRASSGSSATPALSVHLTTPTDCLPILSFFMPRPRPPHLRLNQHSAPRRHLVAIVHVHVEGSAALGARGRQRRKAHAHHQRGCRRPKWAAGRGRSAQGAKGSWL